MHSYICGVLHRQSGSGSVATWLLDPGHHIYGQTSFTVLSAPIWSPALLEKHQELFLRFRKTTSRSVISFYTWPEAKWHPIPRRFHISYCRTIKGSSPYANDHPCLSCSAQIQNSLHGLRSILYRSQDIPSLSHFFFEICQWPQSEE